MVNTSMDTTSEGFEPTTSSPMLLYTISVLSCNLSVSVLYLLVNPGVLNIITGTDHCKDLKENQK